MRFQALLRSIRGWNWRAARRAGWLLVLLLALSAAVPGVRPAPGDGAFQTLGYARDHLFDFVEWEIHALFDKATTAAAGPQRFMTESARTRFVRDYLQLIQDIQQLEAQVADLYADPAVADPEAASVQIRAERDRLRAAQRQQQALAEAIVQAQVSALLVEYGFGVGGQVLPPVAIRFTELPSILVVSPRDRIERIGTYPLQYGITVDQRERIESQVDAEMDVSSLITPIGGLAVWPAMLIETGYLPHVYEVTAHEWVHHYLTFFPLGFNYGLTPELYTINETVANIVGQEIGWAVLDRYYPDLAPPPPDYTPLSPFEPPPPDPDAPPAFDFRAEMRETRIRVDELLAAGQIEEAEQYMEARRVVFVENGYRIRKLNQAYFAFHGSYADQPGATGADPIGPALRELRFYSGSLLDFVTAVRGVTTLHEIEGILEERRVMPEAGR